MYKLLALGILGLAGYGGYKLYTNYTSDDGAYSDADDDYYAGLNFGLTGWKPQLPIAPRSMLPVAEAVYTKPVVTPSRGRPGRLQAARTMDWYNPAQIVASTGPVNIAPLAGVGAGWINLDNDDAKVGQPIVTDMAGPDMWNPADLIAGPLPPLLNSTCYKAPLMEVSNG